MISIFEFGLETVFIPDMPSERNPILAPIKCFLPIGLVVVHGKREDSKRRTGWKVRKATSFSSVPFQPALRTVCRSYVTPFCW